MKKETKQPETFEYLGKIFTPVETIKGDFVEKSKKLWGGGELLKPLECINENGYTHEAFYKAAKKAGAGKFDVFLLNGEKVIPCNKLFYYGAPSWYKKELGTMQDQPQELHYKDGEVYNLSDGKTICRLMDNENREAGKLFAAAPDMFKVLQKAENVLMEIKMIDPKMFDGKLLREINSAISKAKY